jgi:hypothetical protein
MNKMFEEFCREYNLDYDLKKNVNVYINGSTSKAFIVFKYSKSFIEENENDKK